MEHDTHYKYIHFFCFELYLHDFNGTILFSKTLTDAKDLSKSIYWPSAAYFTQNIIYYSTLLGIPC